MSDTNEPIDDGGPAFPNDIPANSDNWPLNSVGMSLRDHFAGLALNGLMANPGGPIQENAMSGWGWTNTGAETVAEISYNMADAMLRARSAVKP